MGNNKKSKKHSGMYSTNPNFSMDDDHEEEETLAPEDQDLRVVVDRKQRKGKEATLVTGFEGSDEDLKELGKWLKQKCGGGGSAKDGEIMVQGNHWNKVYELLLSEGYGVKKSGGG